MSRELANRTKGPGSTVQLALGALALAAGFGGAGYVASALIFRPSPSPAPPARAAATPSAVAELPPRTEAVVVAVRGRVERVSEGGETRVVAVGDRLVPFDSLRTAAEAEAELDIDEHSRLTLTSDGELKLRELTATVHQLRLKRGRLWARYDTSGQRVLRVEDETGTAVAETRASTFSILASGRTLAVATTTGKVNLRAGGEAVDVDAGQQALAEQGGTPSSPTPIPSELLLRLARATEPGEGLCAVIDGSVEPGAEVVVAGERVYPDLAGHFVARVPREPLLAAVQLQVRDVSGRTVERSVPCRPESKAPAVKLEVHWGSTDAG